MRIKKEIEKELNKSVPDLSDKIAAQTDWEKIKFESQKSDANVKSKRYIRTFAAVAAAICCLIVGIAIFAKGDNAIVSSDYSLILDVNPSIKFSVNGDDMVTSQTGLNEDGVILLYKSNFVGENINLATEKVLSEMNNAGLISGKEIRITAVDKDGNVIEGKQSQVSEVIRKMFDGKDIKINFLDKKQLEEIEDYYEDRHISEYEKQAILELKEELLQLVNQKIAEIDELLSVLCEYEKDEDKKIEGFANSAAAEKLQAYSKKYKYKLEFNINKAKYEDVYELCEELRENKEELIEGLEDIEEAGEEGDYAEIFEELIDLAKEELIKH